MVVAEELSFTRASTRLHLVQSGVSSAVKPWNVTAEASLKALGVDAIGLYQFHRPDPKVPYAESIGDAEGAA